MTNQALFDMAKALLDLCRSKRLTIATAESCTGGLVAAALTEVPGSSDVVERGFVTYSNAAKETMLGVPAATLERYGAVSRETAEAMAKGALAHAPADLAVSVTGIAGPGGGSPGKPVGLVHFAAAARNGRLIHRKRKFGDIGRAQVRQASVVDALAMLRELAEQAVPNPQRRSR
jgi:nicotinamide-nucleotide amidase